MVKRGAAEIEQRLRDGAWLTPGEVAAVLGVDRRTVDRMLRADPPVLRYQVKPGLGRHRECDPADVLRELAKRRRVHGDDDHAGPSPLGGPDAPEG